MSEQIILNNGMRTSAASIKYKKRKLYGKKFDKALLETLYKLRGRDMTTRGIKAAMGYSEKNSNVGVRVNKVIKRLEADGYLRVVGKDGKGPGRQFFVLKGIPEVDKAMPAYAPAPAAEPTAKQTLEITPTLTDSPVKPPAPPDVLKLINKLQGMGLDFNISISNRRDN